MSTKHKPILFLIAVLLFMPALLFAQGPTITLQPQNQTVLEKESATFTLTATGDASIAYQWYKNGSSVSGATSNTYVTPATVLADDQSVFYCIVTDSSGSTQSDNATLTVIAGDPATITEQPSNQSILVGQTATFSVTATGTAPIQYQWTKNGVDIAGATSSSYTTPSAIIGDDQSVFNCVVLNNYDTVTSDNAVLYVTDASSRVTSGIQVLYEFEEQSGEVVNDVSGNSNPEDLDIITPENTAWTPNGLESLYSGANIRAQSVDSKIRTNCVASNEITLEVWIQPEFVPQSSRRIFTYSLSGSFRNFSIISEGDHYEFRLTTTETDLNGLPALSSTSGTQTGELTHLVYTRQSDGTAKVYVNGVLDTSGVIPGDLSRFKDNYWLGISSEPLGGLEWRGMFYLAAVYDRALSDFEVQHNYSIGTPVDRVPAFTIQPEDQYIVEGESILLDSYAVSVLPLTYQWTKNGVAIPGETNRKLNLSNLGSLDNGAVFANTATTSEGTTFSNTATVHVTPQGERVNNGAQIMYTFSEGSGNTLNDVSGVGAPLNLTIFSADAVQWENHGLRINTTPSVVTTNSATKVISAIKSSNEITIEAWVSSSNLTQSSPARILTVSADGSNRDFSLGQNNDSYEVNVRTTSTDNNGVPGINSSAGTVSSDGFDHVVFTREADGTAKFYVNGTERVSTTLSGDFSNWNDSYLMSFGNEFGVDNHWEGLMNFIAVFDRALTNSEVLRNYNFGPYGVVNDPSNLIVTANEIGKISLSWDDNSTNEDGFFIERGEGTPITFSVLGSVPEDSTSFTDTTVVDNKDYTYRIKAFYGLGESDYSNEVTVHSLTSPLQAPTNLTYSLLDDGYPQLTWDDNSDKEQGFVIERRFTTAGAPFGVIDSVEANVTSYTDRSVSDSTSYVYRVFAFNADTTSDYSGEKVVDVLVGINDENEIPKEFSLSQNYPNPFNPTTTIKFNLPQNAKVNISVYNLLGQKVDEIVNGNIAAGYHSVQFNAINYTSGIYIYSIIANGNNGNNFKFSKKMILLK